MIKEEEFSSKLLANAVNEFSKLPGIGKKTALRLVLNMLNKNIDEVEAFSNSIVKLKKEVKVCKICNNLADNDVCDICSNSKRDHSVVCVIENIKDIIAIEKTMQFNGVYHVLGGLISPLDGISPSDLNIKNLENRLEQNTIKELIFALNTTMEGETTGFYLYKKMSKFDVEISSIARGVGFGDELEYTDEVTLGRAITNRTKLNL
ncbi:MAG: recombination mediator RecR [Bacteroidota bacterium]|nr:recombination mediator RecR [Bacteroidota bacterium]